MITVFYEIRDQGKGYYSFDPIILNGKKGRHNEDANCLNWTTIKMLPWNIICILSLSTYYVKYGIPLKMYFYEKPYSVFLWFCVCMRNILNNTWNNLWRNIIALGSHKKWVLKMKHVRRHVDKCNEVWDESEDEEPIEHWLVMW